MKSLSFYYQIKLLSVKLEFIKFWGLRIAVLKRTSIDEYFQSSIA